MRRREFIAGLGGAALPFGAWAQSKTGRPYRVGFLQIAARAQLLHLAQAFEDGMRKLGYRVGDNLVFEYSLAEGDMTRLPVLAANLVRRSVDVIVAGNNPNIVAAMQATSSIPVVMTSSVDPVGAGFVASLARPGGNVTGLTQDTGDEINGKRIELLRDMIPTITRAGVLWNPDFVQNARRVKLVQDTAAALGVTLISAEGRGLEEFERAFATITRERVQGLVVLGEPVVFNYRDQLAAMALRHRLPAMSAFREFAESGLLATYGVDLRDLFRRAATFVDKIFKGAKPGDLPVEQPAKFELVLNLKTAQQLGLNISREFLLRADEVIE